MITKKIQNITKYRFAITIFISNNLRVLIVLFLSLFVAKDSFGQVSVPNLFNNNMVLQRGQEIQIWGKAAPNEAVSVELGLVGGSPDATWNGNADGSGDWSAVLPSRSASSVSAPLKLHIIGEANEIIFDSVHCGDVWLCSGQSNMNFLVRPWLPYSDGALDWENEVNNSNISALSIYTVAIEASNEERTESHGTWRPSSSFYAEFFSAVPYFFGKTLREEYNVPIGIIVATIGGTSIKTWSDANTLDGIPAAVNSVSNSRSSIDDNPTEIANYFNNIESYYQNAITNHLTPTYPTPYTPIMPYAGWSYQTSGFFNGMVAPLERFPVKGVAWYQGESDSKDAVNYSTYLHGLVNAWRARRNDPKLPFIIVQLANYNTSEEDSWADLREAQSSILDLSDVALVVTADIGNPSNIHPRDKRTVGERVTLAARHIAYNETSVVHTGPTPVSLQIIENNAYINFGNTGDGLLLDYSIATGDGPNFEIAGSDMVFYPASASVVGESIELSNANVNAPMHVLYAYHNNPEIVLYNTENSLIHLPAAPFRLSAEPEEITFLSETKYEAEDLITTSNGATENDFSDGLLSESKANILNADSVDDYVEYTINVPVAGSYNIKIGSKTHPWRGVFQLHLPQDNVDVGTTHDQYSSGIAYSEFEVGTYTFSSPGDKQFRFIVKGKNASSIRYYLTFDYITLSLNSTLSSDSIDIDKDGSLVIYPIPAKEILNFKYNNVAVPGNKLVISIIDILGKVVLQQDFQVYHGKNDLNLNIENLEGGVYIIKIHNNGEFFSRKIILKN